MKKLMSLLLAPLLIVLLVSAGQQIKKEKPSTKSKLSKTQEKRDSIISELTDLSAGAYQYRVRSSGDGGGGSYKGFTLSKNGPKGIKIVKASADLIVFKKGGIVASLDSTGRVTIK